MAKARYKQIFENIWEENKKLFQAFFLINNEYSDAKKRSKIEKQFQELGGKVKKLLLKGEDELCRHMEKSNHRLFSSKVADKYWDEVRKYFKYIDNVGVSISRM